MITLMVFAIMTSSVLTSCSDVVDEPNIKIKDKGGDLVIKDGLAFKPKTNPEDIFVNDNLTDILRRLDQEKADGIWSEDGEVILSDGDLSVTMSPIFFTGKGLMSIPSETKATFTVNSAKYKDKLKKSNLSFSSAVSIYPKTNIVANDNLCNSFDLRSPGSFLTPEQWINVVRKKKGGSKGKILNYSENGGRVNRHQEEQLIIVVNSIFKACMDMAAKGKTVNPDFLIALSMNETGWGGVGKMCLDRNSWFSYNAVNFNIEKAKAYDTPYDSAVDIIDKLWTNYLNEGGSWHVPENGATIFAANTCYAIEDGHPYPNYSWSETISKIMREAFRINNYNPPNF